MKNSVSNQIENSKMSQAAKKYEEHDKRLLDSANKLSSILDKINKEKSNKEGLNSKCRLLTARQRAENSPVINARERIRRVRSAGAIMTSKINISIMTSQLQDRLIDRPCVKKVPQHNDIAILKEGTNNTTKNCYFRNGMVTKSAWNDSEETIEKRNPKTFNKPHRLYKAAWLVLNTVRLQRHLSNISDKLTIRTAAEMQWYELHASKGAQKLAFDASLFSRERAIDKVPKWAKIILEKDAEERTEEECRKLHAMVRGLKNLDKFTELIQMAMCRAFRYYRVESMRVILRKGHIGVNFYFIYSGSVFINVEDTNSDGETFVRTEVILGHGESFGEVALLKDCPRGATVTSRETCELLVVDKEVFARVCPRIFDIELDQKINFIKNLELCNGKYWSQEQLRDLCFEAQIQQYKTNKVVVKDSAKEEWMYIIMKGSCRIIKCLWLHDQPDDGPEFKDDITVEYLETLRGSRKPSIIYADSTRNECDKFTKSRKSTHRKPVHRKRSTGGQNSAIPTIEICEEQREGVFAPKGKHEHAISKPSNLTVGFHLKRRLSVNDTVSRLSHLLDSMQLDYIKSKKQHNENLTPELARRLPPKHRRSSQHGVISLTTLMRERLDEVEGRDEFVYLDIGCIGPGEIFDLPELLMPTCKHAYARKSCLVLVSSGATILRFRKQLLMSQITNRGLEHARHLAKNMTYPSNSVLIKSFKENRKWDAFRSVVLSETVLSLQHLNRVRNLNATESQNSTSHKQQNRVLRRLNEDNVSMSGSTNPTTQNKHEQPIMSEFESRMLADADQSDDRRKLKPIIPEVTHRRKSQFGPRIITVTQSSNRQGDFTTDKLYE